MSTLSSNTGPPGHPRGIGVGIYKQAGKEPPVTGWTGLWLFPFGIFLVPAVVWFVKVQGGLNRYWESVTATAPATAPSVTPAS